MVALDEKPRHKNTTTRSSKCRGTQSAESGKSVDVCILQRPRITDQKCGSSDDLFITHYSLVIERCASQGMTLDSLTGLYYARNRNYSPSLGRWINQDPAGYVNGANTYQFVEGDPVGNVDSWGLAAGATATGTVTPSTTPGSAPGSGSVTATGTTGPVPTGVPGITVTIGATGTASTGGGYTGSVTGTVTVNTGGGSSVSVSTKGTATGKLTKNRAQPNYQWVVKCQPTIKTPLPGNPPFSPYVIYNPNPGPGNPPWQLGVQSGNFKFNVSPNPGGTTFMITGAFSY